MRFARFLSQFKWAKTLAGRILEARSRALDWGTVDQQRMATHLRQAIKEWRRFEL
ncbi:MAG: hypothetical protein OXG44_15095 [Gammaproteobacteria bacterium]|nr:hypothetical protein [Gammaproteobacteria bacterium]